MIPLHISLDVEEHPLSSKDEHSMFPEKLHDFVGIGVLTEGTDQGNPVVIIRVNLPDGRFVLAQTTLRLLQTAMRVFEAAYGVP